MPNARPWRRGQSPQPRSGAPKAQGLTAAIAAAAQSNLPSFARKSTATTAPITSSATPAIYTTLTDVTKHAGFLPRLCQPYRACTKGKVERFVGYLKGSFWVPFVASMRQLGLTPDKHAANAAVSRWLREVANARVHATIGEIPAERLLIERGRLQSLAAAAI